MQADDSDAELTQTEPPSRGDDSWPAERTPARLDAERAQRPLDGAFMQSFKQSILSQTTLDAAYLSDATERLVLGGRRSPSPEVRLSQLFLRAAAIMLT